MQILKKTIELSLLISIISLLVFYIFQVNIFTKEIYLLKDYKKKLNLLKRENESLEISSAKINSLASLENLIKDLNFKKIGKVRYIRILKGSVVTK